jgi:hypothetical protein
MAGERQGRGMGTAWYVWINLNKAPVARMKTVSLFVFSYSTSNHNPHHSLYNNTHTKSHTYSRHSSWTSWFLKTGRTDHIETSATNYRPVGRNIPAEWTDSITTTQAQSCIANSRITSSSLKKGPQAVQPTCARMYGVITQMTSGASLCQVYSLGWSRYRVAGCVSDCTVITSY